MRILLWLALLLPEVFTEEITGSDLVAKINSGDNTWTAEPNRFTKMSLETKRYFLGTELGSEKFINKKVQYNKKLQQKHVKIPKTFDARKKWKKCKSIGVVMDQGACASDWAISTATITSDRICVGSKGKIKVNISVEDLLTCSSWCSGCISCDYEYPWLQILKYGVVTGGDYGSNEGCKPYSMKPCGDSCYYQNMTTPDCLETCSNKAYKKSYALDKYFGISMYELPSNDEKAIQREILTNGPVASLMKVYEDFYTYHEGVYAYVYGKLAGYHSVKILGWGMENGIKYWLVVNSWGKQFGEGGYFKIRRGINECNIEKKIIALRV